MRPKETLGVRVIECKPVATGRNPKALSSKELIRCDQDTKGTTCPQAGSGDNLARLVDAAAAHVAPDPHIRGAEQSSAGFVPAAIQAVGGSHLCGRSRGIRGTIRRDLDSPRRPRRPKPRIIRSEPVVYESQAANPLGKSFVSAVGFSCRARLSCLRGVEGESAVQLPRRQFRWLYSGWRSGF